MLAGVFHFPKTGQIGLRFPGDAGQVEGKDLGIDILLAAREVFRIKQGGQMPIHFIAEREEETDQLG